MQEFRRIATYLAPLSSGASGAFGLADDVAMLAAQSLIITTDTMVEGVHYLGDEPADLIAKKLVRTNLSDLAAKGAIPKYYTLNLTLTRAQDDAWFAAFARGLNEEQAEYGITLIGGDSTVTGSGPCVLSLTAFGAPSHTPIPRRSGAQVGDILCVSGTIGDAAIGLKIAKHQLNLNDLHDREYLLGRYRLPEPRIKLGQALSPLMNASMDISDGLMQDAGHIASASHVSIEIDARSIPLSASARALIDSGQITLEEIVSGGDDYEILCTMTEEHAQQAIRIANELGTQFTIIGKAAEGRGVTLFNAHHQPIHLEKLGFVHE